MIPLLIGKVGKLEINPCIYNASGAWCMSQSELEALGHSSAGAILIKSTTAMPRAGNQKPRYFQDEWGSLNSMGLPNLGIDTYSKMISGLKKFGKPVIGSVAGMRPEDFVPISQKYLDAGVDSLEVNLSCPNLIGKPQIAFDFVMSRKILEGVKKISKPLNVPVGVKLPPYPDPVFSEAMTDVIVGTGVDYIVCINSVPHASIIDIETESFVIKNKFGGLGGRYIKPVVIGQIARFRELLDGNNNYKIPIIGCGGIENGQDIIEHFLAGASAVQIGTQLMKEGPVVFSRLIREVNAELKKKKIKQIGILTGRAKPREMQIDDMQDY